ncbi:Xaa-Pro peptidase family protein [Mesorhizobium sp. WSM3882]|uniref:M24 family metallopeptidase n=1 Tax=Mesorhizobium sp. WSM3882 TaxID=2029407 RepID=UPI001FD8EF63|nr:Xaa-Pro peptidase family protein [Mesorhizobium sp. WSM3882]
MYYLTGYDTFGFSMFQCLLLKTDGSIALLTRAPDLPTARYTSNINDVRIWVDREGMNPAQDLKDLLIAHTCQGARLGIELASYGLTAFHWRQVEAALAGFCELIDASHLISDLRAIKSRAEIVYIRKAAELADEALDEGIRLSRPGAFEGDILAAMQGAVFRGGGDYAGNEFIIGSRESALIARYVTGRRRLANDDQLTLEFAGAYRRYHACMMHTLLVGRPKPKSIEMYNVCREALAACQDEVRPGNPMGAVFDAQAKVIDGAGYGKHRFNACGYGLGAVYTPLWVDPPMFYHGNPFVMQENMVFFLHMILVDRDAKLAMSLGHTVLVTPRGCEPLSRRPLDLIISE